MTTQEIYNKIIAEKESGKYEALDELNSTSKAAIWRLWIFVFAYFSKSLQDLFENFKAYIEDVFAKNQEGTLKWWLMKLKQFQFGDVLIFKNGIYQYDIIDKDKRIVKQAAIEPLDRQLIIKVAKEKKDGTLEPLSNVEVEALCAYVDRVKFPGQLTDIISKEADMLKLNYRIYYNAQIPKEELEETIKNAINKYLSNSVFNAKFSTTHLTDELQKLEGVINPVFVEGGVKNYYKTEYVEIEDYFTAAAGYCILEELILEFVPYV